MGVRDFLIFLLQCVGLVAGMTLGPCDTGPAAVNKFEVNLNENRAAACVNPTVTGSANRHLITCGDPTSVTIEEPEYMNFNSRSNELCLQEDKSIRLTLDDETPSSWDFVLRTLRCIYNNGSALQVTVKIFNPNDVKFLSGNNVTLTEGLRGEVARFRTIEGRPCNLNHTNKGVSCSNESPSNFCVFENNIAETNCVCYLTPALEDDKRILKFGSERVTLTVTENTTQLPPVSTGPQIGAGEIVGIVVGVLFAVGVVLIGLVLAPIVCVILYKKKGPSKYNPDKLYHVMTKEFKEAFAEKLNNVEKTLKDIGSTELRENDNSKLSKSQSKLMVFLTNSEEEVQRSSDLLSRLQVLKISLGNNRYFEFVMPKERPQIVERALDGLQRQHSQATGQQLSEHEMQVDGQGYGEEDRDIIKDMHDMMARIFVSTVSNGGVPNTRMMEEGGNRSTNSPPPVEQNGNHCQGEGAC